jgi:hypothetical protein
VAAVKSFRAAAEGKKICADSSSPAVCNFKFLQTNGSCSRRAVSPKVVSPKVVSPTDKFVQLFPISFLQFADKWLLRASCRFAEILGSYQ